MSQSQVGKIMTPVAAWQSKSTTVGWQLRWSLNGIQPQRAVVLVTTDITVPANKAFFLTRLAFLTIHTSTSEVDFDPQSSRKVGSCCLLDQAAKKSKV